MSLEPESKTQERVLLKTPKLADILIEKPRNSDKCPVETRAEPLPFIKKLQTKKKPAAKKSSSDSYHYWLEPGVSLPKCQTLLQKKSPNSVEYPDEPPSKSLFILKRLLDHTKISSRTSSVASWKICKDFPNTQEEEVLDHSCAPSRCRCSFSVSATELKNEDLTPVDKNLEPSNALKQWELWLKRRKYQQNVLGKHLNRKPCDLVLNRSDKYRKTVEDKTLYTYAMLPKSDKWRGHPSIWEPEAKMCRNIEDSGDFEKFCPEYFYVKTKLEKGIASDMEFIDVPLAIQKEKGIFYRDSIAGFRDDPLHRKKKKYCLRKLAEKLKPNTIEMEELAVVGLKISQKENTEQAETGRGLVTSAVKVAGEDEDCNEDKNLKISQSLMESVVCLSIREEEIKIDYGDNYQESLNRIEGTFCWEVDFGVSEVGTLVERSLVIENRGSVAVNYEWEPRKFVPKQSLDSLKPSHRDPWLFFDRNSGIFVPGQTYDLKFYHFTRTPGIRTDTWYLKTDPCLFKNAKDGKLLFSAIATDRTLENRAQSLISYLNKRVGETIAKALLEELLYEFLHPTLGLCGIEYRSYFLEEDLFEYHNPLLYYNSTIVKELKELFQEVRLHENHEWDLSVDTLISIIKVQKKTKLWLPKISELARKLLRPKYVLESNNKKYWMSYQILCNMADYIENDNKYLHYCLSKKKRHKGRKEFDRAGEDSEFEEYVSGFDYLMSENGEDIDNNFNGTQNFPDMRLNNFIYYKNMFWIKVNLRLCEAIEHISGIMKTKKSLEPLWKHNF